ncbi:leucine--tRNA ligase [Chloroflexi bacterium TSY]|nr:leucine--tRNA ligase [Chloroflexi bacterium TSY]
MPNKYIPQEIEPKWQSIWEKNKAFQTPTGDELHKRPKYYILDMFPYPSGDGLHVGHPKGYTATDVIARVRRMQNYNVLHPMGWDSFGLPTERAADRANIHPAVITERNINTFRRQLQRLGLSYDWQREVTTSNPDYYKWTQWIFLKLFERGLAYMEDVPVNWCPALGTVLSNEEVQDGKYIETGDLVERRLMRQWMLKITAYAERLLDDLDELDWPESLKQAQRNWIGKSEGAEIRFQVQNLDEDFTAFTTRPDTLFGATYCVLAPEHPLVNQITTTNQQEAVSAYVKVAINKSERQRLVVASEKTGVFTGAYAINPTTEQPIPIWVADYVLMSYGTGAIMAVPAHDERDYEFATQFGLPIVEVVRKRGEPASGESIQDTAYTGDGICVQSGFIDGLQTHEAKHRMIEWLEESENGERQIQYRLRDWLFSRQRYWGEPFPVIHMEDGSIVPLPEEQLPVELPNLIETKSVRVNQPPLSRAGDSWLMVTLPDGRTGVRETNTMPQWAGSCWYYLRYFDPNNTQVPWPTEAEQYWMPVDLYVGGVEHAVLHLLYSRFWHKVLYDCGLVSTKEPFQKLFNQGMILTNSYQDKRGKYYYPHQVEQKDGTGQDGHWIAKESGEPVQTQLEKMSKSRLNVYSLDDVVDQYGADATRLYELFIGPVSASGPWNMAGIEGVSRFLHKVWRLIIDEQTGELNRRLENIEPQNSMALQKELHKTIKNVTESVQSIDKLNTAVSHMMAFINGAQETSVIPLRIMKDFLCLLSPFAPHIAEELWQRLGEESLVSVAKWPQYDETLVIDDLIDVPIQVNGKVRTVIQVDSGIESMALEKLARNDPKVAKYVNGQEIRRVIVIPQRLVNIIIEL